jgi:hypothetical protein
LTEPTAQCQTSPASEPPRPARHHVGTPGAIKSERLGGFIGIGNLTDGPILLVQDTTEFNYQRRNPGAIGFTKSVNSGRDKEGRLRHHQVCGILMHTSLAVTTEGLPLGLAAVKFWSRDKFKGTAQLKRRINPTRVPIETKESIR